MWMAPNCWGSSSFSPEIATPCSGSMPARKTRLAQAPTRIASGTKSSCRRVVKPGSRPQCPWTTTPAPTDGHRRCASISCRMSPRRSNDCSGVALDGVLWRGLQAQGGTVTMPVEIDHDEAQRLVASGAYLLDVREREGFD